MKTLKPNKTISLVPPEGVPLQFELATISERATALILDLFFIVAGTFVLTIAFLLLVVALVGAGGISVGMYVYAFFILGMFLFRQGYFLFFELKWQGLTPGKRQSGIRVVSADGGALTASSIFARNLFRDVEVFVPLALLNAPHSVKAYPAWAAVPIVLWLLVMALMPLFNKNRLRAGDMLAGTMVIKLPKARLLQDNAIRTTPRAFASPIAGHGEIVFSSIHLSVYGEYELETLASILRKYQEGKADRADLRIIARTIADKIGYEGREPTMDPHRFLRVFYASQRNMLEKKLIMGQRKASKHDEIKRV
jgi:uncharacterized RDD family membrane protein YckC